MTDKISLLPTGDKNELAANLEQVKRNLPFMLEYSRIKAQLAKADFDAYVKQGFSEEQALELCKK